jgi:hypothetical protein
MMIYKHKHIYMIIYKPTTLRYKNDTIFAFDIFVKNNILYMIMPVYKVLPNSKDISIRLKDASIVFYKDIIKSMYEAIRILQYKITPNNPQTYKDHIISIMSNNFHMVVNISSIQLSTEPFF